MSDTTTASTPPKTRNPRQCQGWDIPGAAAQAAEKGGPVALVRADGSQNGLMVLPDGQLRRTHLKPQGKAARKEFKKIRRQLRGVEPTSTTARILRTAMKNLCLPS